MPQQFIVPQFIDVESKIIWFITARQFVILLVAGGLGVLAYRLFDFITFIIVVVIIAGLAIVLAFVKVNGQHFHIFLINLITTLRKPALRIWDKSYTDQELKVFIREAEQEEEEREPPRKPPVSSMRLSELSTMVDTGGIYRGRWS